MLDVASLWFDILFNGRLSFGATGVMKSFYALVAFFYQVRTRANDKY